jgi:hypothetical protein
MILFYLPLLILDSTLEAFEISLRIWDVRAPACKANEPTIILLQ